MKNSTKQELCGVCGFSFGIETICPDCGHERSEISSKHCMNGYGAIQTFEIYAMLKKKYEIESVRDELKNPLVSILVEKNILTEDEAVELGKSAQSKE